MRSERAAGAKNWGGIPMPAWLKRHQVRSISTLTACWKDKGSRLAPLSSSAFVGVVSYYSPFLAEFNIIVAAMKTTPTTSHRTQ